MKAQLRLKWFQPNAAFFLFTFCFIWRKGWDVSLEVFLDFLFYNYNFSVYANNSLHLKYVFNLEDVLINFVVRLIIFVFKWFNNCTKLWKIFIMIGLDTNKKIYYFHHQYMPSARIFNYVFRFIFKHFLCTSWTITAESQINENRLRLRAAFHPRTLSFSISLNLTSVLHNGNSIFHVFYKSFAAVIASLA